jgi:predicted nucleic acid-binding protein
LADAARVKDPDWRTVVLWRCEFTSALVKMIRARVLDEPTALTALAAAAADMAPREMDVPHERALRAALRYGISAYDAQYVALAEMWGVSCVTADAALVRKAPGVCVPLADFIR